MGTCPFCIAFINCDVCKYHCQCKEKFSDYNRFIWVERGAKQKTIVASIGHEDLQEYIIKHFK